MVHYFMGSILIHRDTADGKDRIALLSQELSCSTLYHFFYGFMPAHPSFYCRKYCFFKYGLYKIDYKICADFDLLLRYIYVNKISIKYIPLDMVTMRLGGVSTNGIGSHIRIMKEHLRSFRENGVKSNVFMLSIRYLYKITELVFILFWNYLVVFI